MTKSISVEQIAHAEILQCSPRLLLSEAALRMHEARRSSILITDNGALLGIWTERDALAVETYDSRAFDLPIGQAMTSPVKTIPRDLSIGEAAVRLKREGLRHYVVRSSDSSIGGIVTQTDLVLSHEIEPYLDMSSARSALRSTPLLIRRGASLAEAARRMREAAVDAAVTIDADGQPTGILTERDLVRVLAYRRSGLSAEDAASKPLFTVFQDTSLLHARVMMMQRGIRHAGVLDARNRLIGVLSFADILSCAEHEYVYRLEQVLAERNHALDMSERNLRLAYKVIDSSTEGVLVTSNEGIIEFVNPAFTVLTGYEPIEAIGRKPNILHSGHHDENFYKAMWESLKATGHWHGEIWNRRKNGEIFPEWLTITSIRDDPCGPEKYAAIFSDISERKELEESIRRLSYGDALTGLPNRRQFDDRVGVALARAHRSGQHVAVMVLDIDLFSKINDSLGHAVGDLVLQSLAKLLNGVVREVDTVARIGGDEFAILLSEVANVDDAVAVARRIMELMHQPFALAGTEFFLTLSMGIAFYPEDGATLEILVANATSAQHRAKELGKAGFQLYTPSMNTRTLDRLALENDLRRAIKLEEFIIHYQPKQCLKDGATLGMEALIRWCHPVLGQMPPADFIPLAEATGLIVPIGEWVLRNACLQTSRWRREGLPLRVAVNLSARQVHGCDIVAVVADSLKESNLPPDALELELTETLLFHPSEEVVQILRDLRGLGVRLSIDDFGTGYSSLSYLQRFPINVVKIDRSFINQLDDDGGDGGAICQAIIAMAHSLNLEVIGEGVETAAQLAFLRSQGCDEVQGFFLGKPMAAVEFEAFLRLALKTAADKAVAQLK